MSNLTLILYCFCGSYFGFTLNDAFGVSLVLSGNQKSKQEKVENTCEKWYDASSS